MNFKKIALALVATAFAGTGFAQLHMSANLLNNHMWRGIEVANGGVAEADVHLDFANGHATIGAWGGFNTKSGAENYKEVDWYASVQGGGFKLALWDIYNYANDPADEFFTYKARTTGHFLDATLSYDFQQIPLSLSWSTILYGCDRKQYLSGDKMGEVHNQYSNYVQANYTVYNEKGWKADLTLGGAFAFRNGGVGNFFTQGRKGAGIVNCQFKVAKDVVIAGYTIPVWVLGSYNPKCDQGHFQVGATVFSF